MVVGFVVPNNRNFIKTGQFPFRYTNFKVNGIIGGIYFNTLFGEQVAVVLIEIGEV